MADDDTTIETKPRITRKERLRRQKDKARREDPYRYMHMHNQNGLLIATIASKPTPKELLALNPTLKPLMIGIARCVKGDKPLRTAGKGRARQRVIHFEDSLRGKIFSAEKQAAFEKAKEKNLVLTMTEAEFKQAFVGNNPFLLGPACPFGGKGNQ